jgi:mannose-1-phosphate guanylyltransferase
MKIQYSWEPTILGTGGGIKKASEFFKGESLFILNSDILIDLDLKALFEYHKKKKGAATMVVRPRESHFPSILMNHESRIFTIGGKGLTLQNGQSGQDEQGMQDVMYTGAQVLEPKLLDYIPETRESCLIQDGYHPALHAGEKVHGYLYNGYWNDIGTFDRYRQAENDLNSGKITLSY